MYDHSGYLIELLRAGEPDPHHRDGKVDRVALARVGRAERDADRGDLDTFVRDLKATVDGELDVAGPELAAAVAPLIDEYPALLQALCARRRQAVLRRRAAALHLVAADRVGEDAVRLTYVPT